jgi:hypothetical protein
MSVGAFLVVPEHSTMPFVSDQRPGHEVANHSPPPQWVLLATGRQEDGQHAAW